MGDPFDGIILQSAQKRRRDITILSHALTKGAALGVLATPAVVTSPSHSAAACEEEQTGAAFDNEESEENRLRQSIIDDLAKPSDGDADAATTEPREPQPQPQRMPDEGEDEDDDELRGAAGGGAMISDNPEDVEYCPVAHPHYQIIEKKLGQRKKIEDQWCYLCEVLATTEPENRPREVANLVAKVAQYNYDTQDKVDVAVRIKTLFEETIRRPANRKRRADGSEVIREWTLRSIYTHVTEKSNSSSCILEDISGRLHRAMRVIDQKMYRAPVEKVRSRRVTEGDLKIEKADLQNLMAVTSQLLRVIGQREKLRSTDADGAGGGAPAGTRRTTKRGAGGAETVGTLGGKMASAEKPTTSADKALQAGINGPYR